MMKSAMQERELSAKMARLLFWTIVPCCAAIWVLLPGLFHSGYRNDVIEIIVVGREWVSANAKHPALTAWLAEIALLLTNKAFVAPFLVGQLCAVVTVWSVWRLARTVLSEKYALIAALATLSQRLLTNESILFNHNLVLLACYALTVFLVFQAFQTNRLRYWTGAGLVIGLGMNNKYPFAMVAVAIVLYMLLRPAGRKHWRGIGPYLTTGIAFLVFLPHLIWLHGNDYLTLGYVSSRMPHEHWWSYVLSPLKFSVSQVTYWIPSLVVLFPAIGWLWTWKKDPLEDEKEKECERFLFYCAVVPVLFHILACVKADMRMVYGAPFWCFFGLWLMLRVRPQVRAHLVRNTVLCLAAVECVLVVGFFTTFYGGRQPQPVYLPMEQLAAECDRTWSERQFSTPCPYVTGDMILAGHAAYRMPNRPSVHYEASTWSTIADVNAQGGIVLWYHNDSGDPAWVRKNFPTAEIFPAPLVLPDADGKLSPQSIRVRIAVIPPPGQD